MARILPSRKACAVNPLKMSAPLGGAMAFMGLDGCLPLLHGSEVFDDVAKRSDHQPSTIVQAILKRAKELNEKGIAWHHHMLFPDCQFNSHPGKFCLMLEDPETGKTYESVTDQEPIFDLQQIEPLYTAQTI